MPKRKSNVKIENGKAVLSDEVLKIIESWRTEENSIWIDEYLNLLLNNSIVDCKKSRGHHIIPCFVFKDDTHKTRKETESLADKIEGNIIELSICNHLVAHYHIWKIFKNNLDAKMAFQRSCKQENIDNLTQEEVYIIGKMEEECAKTNKTEEEIKAKNKEYNEIHKEERNRKNREYNKTHKKEKAEYNKRYRELNEDDVKKKRKIYNEKNKEERNRKGKEYGNQKCYDPEEKNYCTLYALRTRKRRHPEKYKDVTPTDYIIKQQ